MEDVSLAHAKDHLEELIARASRGEEVRISAPELGTVRLLPVAGGKAAGDDTRPVRRPGRLKGKLTVPARLFEPMTEEELKLWYGEADRGRCSIPTPYSGG